MRLGIAALMLTMRFAPAALAQGTNADAQAETSPPPDTALASPDAGWADDPSEPDDDAQSSVADPVVQGATGDAEATLQPGLTQRQRDLAELRARRAERAQRKAALAAPEQSSEEAYERYLALDMGAPITLLAVTGGIALFTSLYAMGMAFNMNDCEEAMQDDCLSDALPSFIIAGLSLTGFAVSAVWVSSRNSERRQLRQQHRHYFLHRHRHGAYRPPTERLSVAIAGGGLALHVDF